MNILKKIKGLTIPVMVIALCLISYAPVQAAAMHDITTGDVIFTNDAQVTADLRVDGTTMVVDGAANTVSLGGATTVTTGGLTVSAGGLTVTDGNTSFGNGGDTITLGSGATDTITVSGTMTAAELITANGGVTSTTLTASGATNLNGAINLGDAAGDAITVAGTITAAELITANGGVTSTTLTASGATNLNGAINLGDAAGDAITVAGTITAAELITANGGVTSTTLTASGATNLNGTINLGDASGDTVTIVGDSTFSNALNANGATTIGDAITDDLTITAAIQGDVSFDGTTGGDGFEATFVFTNPTADRTITFKNESGTVAYLADITNTTPVLVADLTDHVVTDDYSVTDADDVEIDLFAGDVPATGAELTELHIHSLFPTVSFRITASDAASSVIMYGPGTAEVTVSTNCAAASAIGNTGIEVCVDNAGGAGGNQLVFSGNGVVGTTHSFGFSMLAKANDGA